MSDEMKNQQTDRYLTFSLGLEDFAIPLLKVKEVIALPEITPVPQSPAHFLGIANLRGQIITVMDLRNKLGIKSQQSAETVVIICDLGQYSIGVVVDSVNSVVPISGGQISSRPDLVGKGDYITGVYQSQGGLVLLLDIAKALNLQDQNLLQKVHSDAHRKMAA